MRYNIKVRKTVYVPLAQLDRVFGYEPKGRGFESLMPRQKILGIIDPEDFLSCHYTFEPPRLFAREEGHRVRFRLL